MRWISILVILMPLSAGADSIYSCKEVQIATLQWEEAGLLSKAGIKGKTESPGKEPSTVALVVSGKKAMFKGNAGESSLQVLDEVTFLERPPMGNAIMWRLIPAKDKIPTFLVQFKGYDLSGPYIHAWVFKCD